MMRADRLTTLYYLFILMIAVCMCNDEICGRTVYNQSGADISPSLPEGIFSWPNLQCTYKIYTTEPVPVILPYINLLCGNDSIAIYDGPDSRSPELFSFCGIYRALRYPKWSSSDTITIILHSARFTRATGFHLIAGRDLIASSTECSAVHTTAGGMIVSPGYPHNHGSHSVCYWNIRINMGELLNSLQLVFQDFRLQNEFINDDNKLHCHDFLHVYGDNCDLPHTENLDTSKEYCGNSLSGKTVCNRNGEIFLYFYSDDTVNDRGFNITWGDFSRYIENMHLTTLYPENIPLFYTTTASYELPNHKIPISISICVVVLIFVVIFVGVAVYMSEKRKAKRKRNQSTDGTGFSNPVTQEDNVNNNNTTEVETTNDTVAITNQGYAYDQDV